MNTYPNKWSAKGLYVDSERGSDANASTSDKPLKTIAQAQIIFEPSKHDAIYVITKLNIDNRK